VRDDAKRAILFDMETSIQRLRRDVDDDKPALITLTGDDHSLVRQ